MAISRSDRFLIGTSALVLMLAASAANAQSMGSAPPPDPTPRTETTADEPQNASTQSPERDIVVTGTLIRGTAPTGTNVIALGQKQIAATGATTTNDVLARIPQVTSGFLAAPTISQDGGNTTIRPNLRDLGRASGSTTLVLIDGHRVRPSGDTDPDVIPPGALERVEIVPDGGSSTYGSDAIGGVVNLITRRSFDGIELIAHRAIGDEYTDTDINLTAGKKWATGSAFISYSYQRNDAIFGRDRDFLRQISGDGRYCPPGTIEANGTLYSLPGRVPGVAQCDNTDNFSYRPAAERQSIFGAFNQKLSDVLSLDVRGYYNAREYLNYQDLSVAQAQTLTVTNQNPYFQSIAGESTQTVYTSFGNIFSNRSTYRREEFRINPTLTAKLGGTWQLRASGVYDWNRNRQFSPGVDAVAVATAAAGTTTATALNPYNLGATNPTVLAGLLREGFAGGEAELYQLRAIADGTAFQLPGGDVRLAVGVEYLQELTSNTKNGSALPGQTDRLPNAGPDSERSVKSLFGEVVVPIFGAENGGAGYQALNLSASARYDSYSDVGDTFNPKFGIDYTPVEGFKLRANWGKSFNAPPVGLGTSGVQAFLIVPAPLVPGQTAPNTFVLAGFAPSIKPQTATTWSAGFDVRPTQLPGLHLSATYYNISLKDQIGLLGLDNVSLNGSFSKYIQDKQTCAQVQNAYGAPYIDFFGALPGYCGRVPQPTFTVIDLRQQNLGRLKQDGIDFDVGYQASTGFGAINASFAGTYILNRKTAVVAGAPFVDDLRGAGVSRLFFVASVGAQVGNLTATALLNHRQGYKLNPVVTTPRFGTQTKVDSFNTVDLFVAYKLPSTWLNDDTSLTLNVTNLFDQDPPFYNGCIGTQVCGIANGATLGRLVTFGVRTRF